MTPEQLKVILSAEDRTAAIFGSVARNVDKMGLNFDTLKAQAIGALGALSVPISAAGLLTMVSSARQAVDAIKDLQDVTGASVENISALDSIARSTGSNIDTVGAALVKFNGVLKDADPGKGAGAVLKALNLDIAELKKLDPAEALRQVAIALNGYADDGERARAVQELFGKSVKEVGGFLRDLAEAKRLDARLTADQAEQVDRFNKEWARLKATAEDASRSFSVGIISDLNGIIDKFAQAEKAGKSFLSVVFASSAEIEAKNRASGAFGLGKMQDAAQARAELKNLESATFRLSDQDPRMIAARERVRQAEAALNAAGGGRGFVNPANVTPSAPVLNLPKPTEGNGGGGRRGGGSSAVADPDAAYRRYRDNLQKGIEAAQNMSAIETALRDIQLGRIGQVSEAQRDEILNLARISDQMEEGKEAARKQQEADRQAAAAKKELLDAGQRYFEATRTDQERLLANLAEIDRLQQAGAISAETAGRAAARAYGEAAQKVQELTQEQIEAQRLSGQFGSAFSSAANDVIFRSGDAADAVRNLGAEIARIIVQRQVIEPLATAGGNLLGNWLSGFSFDGGGYTGMGARSGGLDGKGGFPAILHPNETVIDHSRGQGLGGVTVNNYISAPNASAGTLPQIEQMLRASEARTKADIMNSINRGGSWARATGRA